MMNTSARLLRLLALLSARPSVTCGELAAQLSVTDRTIRRDISRLRELGYVIDSEPGPWGGYRLGRGTSLPPLILDDDEALAVANDSHLGLQAAVYTRSLKRAFRYLDNLQVGNVVVNDSTDYWEAHEPFGGASGTRTGWGRIGGRYTMLDMTDLKTAVLDVGGLE